MRYRNQKKFDRNKKVAPNAELGVGGVDSYDLDATVDGRGSKGSATPVQQVSHGAPIEHVCSGVCVPSAFS